MIVDNGPHHHGLVAEWGGRIAKIVVVVVIKKMKVPPRFELGLLDSESNVLTTRPWNLTIWPPLIFLFVDILFTGLTTPCCQALFIKVEISISLIHISNPLNKKKEFNHPNEVNIKKECNHPKIYINGNSNLFSPTHFSLFNFCTSNQFSSVPPIAWFVSPHPYQFSLNL